MNQKATLRLLILSVLDHQPEHGYAIAQAIRTRSAGTLDAKEGSLYPALHLLEKDGLLSSREVHAAGRTRREYHLTEQGRRELVRARGEWQQRTRAVQAVLGGGPA